MKFAQDAAKDLSASAQRVDQAIALARESMTTQLQKLVADVQQVAQETPARMDQVIEELTTIPPMLDPGPIVKKMNDAVAQGRMALDDVVRLGQEAAASLSQAVPSLKGQMSVVAQQASAMTDRASTVAKAQSSGSLLSLPAVPASIRELPSRLPAWWKQASGALGIVQAYGADVSQLTKAAASTTGVEQAETLRDRCKSSLDELEATIVSDIDALQRELAADLAPFVGGASGSRDGMPASASLLVDGNASALTQSWDLAIASANAKMESARAALPTAVSAFAGPVNQAQRDLASIGVKLNAVGDRAKDGLSKVLSSTEGINAAVGRLVTLLSETVAKCRDEIEAIKQILKNLVDRAVAIVAKLDSLPERFVPARSAIDAALAQIEQIIQQVPQFVAQALGTLNNALGELSQAGSLCDNAIAVCTRYMIKAPLLIPARALFMGIKATIPAVVASVQSAKGVVQTAGTTTQQLLTKAKVPVSAINPLLDQAIAALKSAAATLVTLIRSAEQKIKLAFDQLGVMVSQIEGLAKSANQNLDAMAQRALAAARDCAKRVDPQPQIEQFNRQLSASSDRVFNPIKAGLDSVGGPIATTMERAEKELMTKARELKARLESALREGDSLDLRLRELEASGLGGAPLAGVAQKMQTDASSALDRMRAKVQGALSASRAQVDGIHAQAMQSLSPSASAS